MASGDFIKGLLDNVPEVRPILDEHVADNGEVLLHLFVARVRDAATAAFENGDRKLSGRIVAVFESGLRNGDEQVKNAVAVSFVEDTPWWEADRQAFIATWPKALREEVKRQKNWHR